MPRRRMLCAVCVAAGLVTFTSCSSGPESTGSSDPVASDESLAETTGSSSKGKSGRESVPASTVPEQVEELASAISVLTLGRLVLFPPEAVCVDAAFADLPSEWPPSG